MLRTPVAASNPPASLCYKLAGEKLWHCGHIQDVTAHSLIDRWMQDRVMYMLRSQPANCTRNFWVTVIFNEGLWVILFRVGWRTGYTGVSIFHIQLRWFILLTLCTIYYFSHLFWYSYLPLSAFCRFILLWFRRYCFITFTFIDWVFVISSLLVIEKKTIDVFLFLKIWFVKGNMFNKQLVIALKGHILPVCRAYVL